MQLAVCNTAARVAVGQAVVDDADEEGVVDAEDVRGEVEMHDTFAYEAAQVVE